VAPLTPSRIAAVLAAGVVAAGGTVLLGRAERAPSATPTSALSVRASFEPPAVQFGDPVTARIIVLLDRRAVEPRSLHLVDPVAPLTELGSPRTTRFTRGRLVVVSIAIPAACLSQACIAERGARRVAPPNVEVEVARSGGGVLRAKASWPRLAVAGRVAPADLAAASPPFRADTSPPPPDYRMPASRLALLLDALAVALALAGVALAAGVMTRRTRRTAELDELERALQLARGAGSRPAPDRRRAVGLVARVLRARDRELADRAGDLAWSRTQPAEGAVAELVDEVEETLRP
jgi:hypothetical protein